MELIYAVRNTKTGKLLSDLTNPSKKFWEKKQFAERAIRKNQKWYPKLELVTFKLVEVKDDAE